MENLIPEMYREYGIYKNKRQMFPNMLDGLLPVQKRILLTAHTIAKNKFIKTFKILGENMSRWHPHSEALGTAKWAIHNEFLDGDGQWGYNIGVEKSNCAAPRYTSLKMNNFIEEMAFKMVKSVVWEPDEADPEPIAIPTMLPFCLMTVYEISSIGFGFKADIPCYKIKDLVKRLLFLLTGKNKTIIKPNPIGCNIISSAKECEVLLTEGKGIINIQGKHKIDNKNKIISIFGWNPRQSFQKLFERIDKYKGWELFSKGIIRYTDESDQRGTQINFEVVKKRNVEETFEKMVEAVTGCIKTKLDYNIVAIAGDSMVTPSVDDMLLSTYTFYKSTLVRYTKDKINNLSKIKLELEVIKKIRPYISEVTKKNKDVDKMCKTLANKTKCNEELIREVVDKYKIKKLLSTSTDIKGIEDDIGKLKDELKNIKGVCFDRYKELGEMREDKQEK